MKLEDERGGARLQTARTRLKKKEMTSATQPYAIVAGPRTTQWKKPQEP